MNSKNHTRHIEFITENKIISLKDEIQIDKFLSKHLRHIKHLICLDFHGVADLYNINEQIPIKLPGCIISYIGGSSKTRRNTIQSIMPRIINGEILFGILVYTKNETPIYGTKGWILKKITNVPNIYFIDDSITNIKCVNAINNTNIKTFLINKKRSPKEQLNKLLEILVA